MPPLGFWQNLFAAFVKSAYSFECKAIDSDAKDYFQRWFVRKKFLFMMKKRRLFFSSPHLNLQTESKYWILEYSSVAIFSCFLN